MRGEEAWRCELVVIQKYQNLTPGHAGGRVAGGSGASVVQSDAPELEFEPQRLDRVAGPVCGSVIRHDDFKSVGGQRLVLQGSQGL
jgi:hypothetical protein